MAKKNKELKGIGGWLIVILIAFSITIISCAVNAFSFLILLIKGNLLYLLFTVIYGFLTFLFTYSLISMMNRRKISKKLAIFSLWLGFFVYIILVIVSNLNNSSSTNLYYFIAILNGIGSLILTKYFLHSKRVKNTFTK